MDILFEVISNLGKRIRITTQHWEALTRRKHLEIAGREKEIQTVLRNPDVIRLSQQDANVFLYYKRSGRYHLCVVCRHLNGEGFIVTSYLTDKVKEGKELWRK